MRSMLRDDYVGYNESRDEWEWLSCWRKIIRE